MGGIPGPNENTIINAAEIKIDQLRGFWNGKRVCRLCTHDTRNVSAIVVMKALTMSCAAELFDFSV